MIPARLVRATPADHVEINQLLTIAFGQNGREAFEASLEEPGYEPGQRLLVRRADRLVGHLHVQPRTIRLGDFSCPAAVISGLAMLPEFHRQGFEPALLRAAERTMRERGLLLGLATTREPKWLAAAGWTACGRRKPLEANTRDLLSRLSVRGFAPGGDDSTVRPWRQIELPALIHLYAACAQSWPGSTERSEAHWRWLVARGGYDRIYVARPGPDRFCTELDQWPMLGYAVVKDDRILELLELRGHASRAMCDVAEQLLARVASDAMERGSHSVGLYPSHGRRLHELFPAEPPDDARADGSQEPALLARIVDPLLFLRQAEAELLRRARMAHLTLPAELGIEAAPLRLRIVVSRSRVRVTSGKVGRSYVRLTPDLFSRMLLGQVDAAEAIAAKQMRVSTRLALELVSALFPRLPFARPAWDEPRV